MNIYVQIFVWIYIYFFISWGIFWNCWAGSYDNSMFNILRNCQTWLHYCTMTATIYEGSNFSTSLLILVIVYLFIVIILVGMKWPLVAVFGLHFLNDWWASFHMLVDISVSSLEEFLFKSFTFLKIGSLVFIVEFYVFFTYFEYIFLIR